MLVRIAGAGVCATDLQAIDGEMEPAGLSPPIVLGHENAGWVEATGDFVATVAPGDGVSSTRRTAAARVHFGGKAAIEEFTELRWITAGLTALPALKRLAASTQRGRVRAD